MKRFLTIIALFILAGCNVKNPNLILPALLTDHMVLQQNTKVNLWGWSTPKTKITVETSWGKTERTTAANDGKWMVRIETPKAGGPYTVTVKAGKIQKVINNVMIGEVWLCSGQSNMEMPLKGWPPADTINFSGKEIADAQYPAIRMFTVSRKTSDIPLDTCEGAWQVCSPSTVGDFSATAYFYGLKLYKELKVPIGLIHSSWGGTPAESWTSHQFIGKVPGFESFPGEVEEMQKSIKEYHNFLSKLENIPLTELPKENPFKNLDLKDTTYLSADINNTEWKEMGIPQGWESGGLPAFDGIVWFARDFEYNDTVYPEGIKLFLGTIDDMDVTYINGQKIGGYETDGFWNVERWYDIPHNILKKGTNRIMVKVTDTRGGGGIYGSKKPTIMKGDKILTDLSGNWKYKPIAAIDNDTIYVYGKGDKAYDGFKGKITSMNEYTATTLYNGMIAPLTPYTIKGAIWYQGESNVGRGKQYETLFPEMIKSWRKAWNQGNFPFYFVQIAPYNYGEDANERTAELRNAQLKTLALENTGMAVTMDIGNPVNIHPGNKKDVGNRLALWALDKTYKLPQIICSGPLLKNVVFDKNKAEVSFDYGSGLVLKTGESFFEIAGSDGVFYPAKAEIVNDKIIATSDKVKETKQIRYAWCDDCVPNLFNGDGLPASPFIYPND